MKTPEPSKNKKVRQVNDLIKPTGQNQEPVDDSLEQIIPLDLQQPRTGSRSSSSKVSQQPLEQSVFQNAEVPIYKLNTTNYSFKASLSEDVDACFAEGCLAGTFYTTQGQVRLQGVKFYGNFKGVAEQSSNRSQQIYFEGKIQKFCMIQYSKNSIGQNQDIIQELQKGETSFIGLFKGSFYRWGDYPSLHNIKLHQKNIFQISQSLNTKNESLQNCNNYVMEKMQKQKKVDKNEYFLPTVVRFQVHDIRQINLQKSTAAISGMFFVEIRYNQHIKNLIKQTNTFLKVQRKKGQKKFQKYKSLLKIELNFHRDYNLTLDLQDEDDSDSEGDSQGSEWSIMDKVWDIVKDDDQQNKVFHFSVWKRFNVQIDNSYGAFFAPFNLSILRIVMTLHHFLVRDGDQTVKVHLVGTDVLDYDPKVGYDPFKPFNDLESHRAEDRTYEPHINRIHKINRFHCVETGSFIIADNQLRLFPYFRNILQNTYTMNEDQQWSLGLKDKKSLMQNPPVRSVTRNYNYFDEQNNNQKVDSFHFQKWSYVLVEIPIYKYVVIDMLTVFVPLTLLSVFSLFVFTNQNGVSPFTGYTILVTRLINVGSLMIAYVSLIPVVRESLPPMPGITLVELVTYAEILPNILAIVSSLLSYQISTTQWLATYMVMQDALFVISLGITILNLVVLVIMFGVYMKKEYTVGKGLQLPPVKERKNNIRYRSPCYMRFMENVRLFRKECRIQKYLIE